MHHPRALAFRANRALVVAPGVSIAGQLVADFDPSTSDMFYEKCHVLAGGPYPEPVEIRGTTTNRADLDEAHVVITNIGQLQGVKKIAGCELCLRIFSTSSCSTRAITASRKATPS